MKRRSIFTLAAALCVAAVFVGAGCKPSAPPDPGKGSEQAAGGATGADKKPTVAYVTNGIASFWVIAEKGAKAAEKQFDCNVEVRMPPADGAVANQQRMIEELLTLNVDGIAVSPIDPANQTEFLNSVAAKTRLITHDADAPDSKRIAYIGMDNYTAGRMCGKLVKEALPDGGSVMVFVGRLEQLNAKLRRQGLIDELLDRSVDPARFDEPGQEIKGDKYVILDTRTDNFDFGAAKALPEDAIAKHPDLGCMVGLFAYNPPYILEALRGADKLGKVKVVAFDEADETLQAIKDGHCYGTVVQNPYQYGFESVRLLAALARGDESVLPKGGFLEIGARAVKKDDVDAFWTELKELTSTSGSPRKEPAEKSGEATKSDAGADQGAAAAKPQPPAAARQVPAGEKAQIAFVTNNASDFWKIAEAGVRKGEAEFNASCELLLPPNGTADDQQRIIEALIAKGISGMAISPNDAENQIDIINKAAEQMAVITHDSDAPKSNRLVYVGTNNFKAGREAGKLIKETLPKGGRIMLFVGRIDAQNALDRANGIKAELEGSGIEVLDIRTDLTDRARAKQNVEDTLTRYPDVGCLVGLWSYNGPAILEAVKEAGLQGKKPIVCFDEEDGTLQGVLDGHIHATVVQQPFEFGYQSVRILAAFARRDQAAMPSERVVEVPVQVVRPATVKKFWDDLKAIKAGGA